MEDQCIFYVGQLSFQIKTLKSIHSCKKVFDNFQATFIWIAAQFLYLFKIDPDLDNKVTISKLKRKYKITCHPIRLYRARYDALKLLWANFNISYNKLYGYKAAIEEANIGSIVDLQREWISGEINS